MRVHRVVLASRATRVLSWARFLRRSFVALIVPLVAGCNAGELISRILDQVDPPRVFWTDDLDRALYSSLPDGSGLRTELGNLTNPRCLAIGSSGDYLYYGDADKIYRFDRKAGDSAFFFDGNTYGLGNSLAAIVPFKDDVIAANYSTSLLQTKVSRVSISGLFTPVATVAGYVSALAVDESAGKIYFAVQTDITRMNIDGTNVELIHNVGTGVLIEGLYVDKGGGTLYWVQRGLPMGGAPALSRCPLNGGAEEHIVSGSAINQPYGVAVDSASGEIYWTDQLLPSVRTCKLDGSGARTLVTTTSAVDVVYRRNAQGAWQ